ncbi:MAG TPA: FAD-binding oxidoreductase, partial [Chitinophagales bacterium]|nr:FAD-binding oxidoreductase [Chitinophagales bacterium]
MINQNWWTTTLLVNTYKHCPPLTRDIKCDVLIVGGGFCGISAAAEFYGRGLTVVIIEKNIIGGGSSGKSAGFLTPDSELELEQLVRRFGVDAARDIWDAPCMGIDRIVNGIKKFDISCGLEQQDSLFLGLGKGGKKVVAHEKECREKVGFTDQKVYDQEELKTVFGGEGYSAAIRYGGTYGINPLACLQGYKNVLIDHGFQVYESTEMERLEGHTVYTHGGSVTADKIIIAIDKMEKNFHPISTEIFHAQTFMSVSEPLTDKERDYLFPGGENFQCWDSSMVYSYFRLTGDQRLVLGGGTALTTFLRNAYNNPRIIKKVIRKFKEHFPGLKDLSFIQFWPGLIDTSRDLLPVIAKPDDQPHIQFIFGCVGIPWASFTGSFAARNI